MAGGRANRMGRGVLSVDKTKSLMIIPRPDGGKEMILERTIRLLNILNSINDDSDILLCTGYKEELVKSSFPNCQFLTTYDVDDPTDVLPAYGKVIDAFPNLSRHIFLDGDVVWSMQALKHFLLHQDKAPMVLYHGTNPYYCEIFGFVLNGQDGMSIVRNALDRESMPVIKGEIRWKGHDVVPIKQCRTSTMEQWIDLNKIPGKLRVFQSGAVDDVDWDKDHQRITNEIKKGVYGLI